LKFEFSIRVDEKRTIKTVHLILLQEAE